MKKQINIGLLGFGVVGSGTMQILKQHKKEIESRVGARIKVLWVCSRRKKKSKYLPATIQQTTDWRKVINDPKVDCIVELIGGTNPARQIVISALKAKKHVVTANKAILAKYWDQIMTLANKNKCLVDFEAAVGGGIPVIEALNEGLAANRITRIVGILNGTTNYILTQMQEKGLTFATALRMAQKAGFAEANPSFDVNGIDAAQKISILSSLAIGQWVNPADVYCEGITKINPLDLRFIEEKYKGTVKLLAIAEMKKKAWTFRVHPTIILKSHPFANVRNEYNAISFYGDEVEDVMFYGKGAGKMATSSAVVSDIIFISRQIANGTAGNIPYVNSSTKKNLKSFPISNIHSKYYIRVSSSDHPGVLTKITGILSRNGVSIASIYQDSFEDDFPLRGVPIIFVTHENLESNVHAAVQAINNLSTTLADTVVLRME